MRMIIILMVAAGAVACKGKETADSPTIGIALYSFNRFSLEETLEKAKQCGVQHVEGFSFHHLKGKFGNKAFATLSDTELSDVRSLLGERDLNMVSMYADGQTSAEWQVLFDKGKQLGLEFLVGEPEPHLWDELDKLAAQYRMKLAIHQHAKGQSRFWHPDSVLVALDGRPNFVVCGDIGHWVRSGLDPVECLRKLEGHLVSIHAKDLDSFGNVDAVDVNIGHGVIDYGAVFAELKRQGFDGHVFVECEHNWDNNFGDVKEDIQFLNGLLNQFDDAK